MAPKRKVKRKPDSPTLELPTAQWSTVFWPNEDSYSTLRWAQFRSRVIFDSGTDFSLREKDSVHPGKILFSGTKKECELVLADKLRQQDEEECEEQNQNGKKKYFLSTSWHSFFSLSVLQESDPDDSTNDSKDHGSNSDAERKTANSKASAPIPAPSPSPSLHGTKEGHSPANAETTDGEAQLDPDDVGTDLNAEPSTVIFQTSTETEVQGAQENDLQQTESSTLLKPEVKKDKFDALLEGLGAKGPDLIEQPQEPEIEEAMLMEEPPRNLDAYRDTLEEQLAERPKIDSDQDKSSDMFEESCDEQISVIAKSIGETCNMQFKMSSSLPPDTDRPIKSKPKKGGTHMSRREE